MDDRPEQSNDKRRAAGRRQNREQKSRVPERAPNVARTLILKRKAPETEQQRPAKQRRIVNSLNEEDQHAKCLRFIVESEDDNRELEPEPTFTDAVENPQPIPLEIIVNREDPDNYPIEVNVKKIGGRHFQKIVMSIQRKTSPIVKPEKKSPKPKPLDKYTNGSDSESDGEQQTAERQSEAPNTNPSSNPSHMSAYQSVRSVMEVVITDDESDSHSVDKEPAVHTTPVKKTNWPVQPSPYRSNFLSHPHNILDKPAIRLPKQPKKHVYSKKIMEKIMMEYREKKSAGRPMQPYMLRPLNVRLELNRSTGRAAAARRNKDNHPILYKNASTMTVDMENKDKEKQPPVNESKTITEEVIQISDNSASKQRFVFSVPLYVTSSYNDKADVTTESPNITLFTGDWSCSVCLVPNKMSAETCVCCGAAKPAESDPSSLPTDKVFQTPEPVSIEVPNIASVTADWSCSVCLVPNKMSAETCVCCGVAKPAESDPSTLPTDKVFQTPEPDSIEVPNIPSVTADWSCSVCLVPNKMSAETCVCCGVAKPAESDPSTLPTDKVFQTPEPDSIEVPNIPSVTADWSCSVCLVPNKMSAETCVCCGVAKPAESDPSSLPTDKVFQTPEPVSIEVPNIASVTADWSCSVCLVPNKMSAETCVCCGVAKPAKSDPSSLPTDKVFQTPETVSIEVPNIASVTADWSCSVCLVPNKMSAETCVCCGVAKPTESDPYLPPVKVPQTSQTASSNVSSIAANWSCAICLIRNKIEDEKCTCCGAEKFAKSNRSALLQNKEPQTPQMTSTGLTNISLEATDWSCTCCLMQNKTIDTTCTCCGASKTGESAQSTSTSSELLYISPVTKDWVCVECWQPNKGSEDTCANCSSNMNRFIVDFTSTPPYDFKTPIDFTCPTTSSTSNTTMPVALTTTVITPKMLADAFNDCINSGEFDLSGSVNLHAPIADNLNDNTHSAPIISERIFNNNNSISCDDKNNNVDSIGEFEEISTPSSSHANVIKHTSSKNVANQNNAGSEPYNTKDIATKQDVGLEKPWFCYTCHRNNPATLNKCDGCNIDKPVKRGKVRTLLPKKPESDPEFEPTHWVCSKCKFTNYTSKIWCSRCNAMLVVPDSLKYCTPISFNPHDWVCGDCGCHCSENSLTCLGCGNYRRKRKATEQPRWKCPQCYTLNYGRIHTCSGCSTNKLIAMEALIGLEGDVLNGDEDLRSWQCSKCKTTISGMLQSCPSCGFEKYPQAKEVDAGDDVEEYVPEILKAQVQQWMCQNCNLLNVKNRTKCDGCNTARASSSTSCERPGKDWVCSKCSHRNLHTFEYCTNCQKSKEQEAPVENSHCQKCDVPIKHNTSLCLPCAIENYQPYKRLVRELNFKRADSLPKFWICTACKAINVNDKCVRCESPKTELDESLPSMLQICIPDCKYCKYPDSPTPVKCMGCNKADRIKIFKDESLKPEDPQMWYCTDCWSREVIVITICSNCTEKLLANLVKETPKDTEPSLHSEATKTVDTDWTCDICTTVNFKSAKRCRNCEAYSPTTKFYSSEINAALKNVDIINIRDFEREINQFEATRPQRSSSFPNARRGSPGKCPISTSPIPFANRCETPTPISAQTEDVSKQMDSLDEQNNPSVECLQFASIPSMGNTEHLSETPSQYKDDCMQMDEMVPSSIPVEVTAAQLVNFTTSDVFTTKPIEVTFATGFTFARNNNNTTTTCSQGSSLNNATVTWSQGSAFNDTTATWPQGSTFDKKPFDFGVKTDQTAASLKPINFDFNPQEKKGEKAPVFEFQKQPEIGKSMLDLFPLKKSEQTKQSDKPFQFGNKSENSESSLSGFMASKSGKSMFEMPDNKKPFEFGKTELSTSNLRPFQFGVTTDSNSTFQSKKTDESKAPFTFGSKITFPMNKQPENLPFSFGINTAQESNSKPFEFGTKNTEVRDTTPFDFKAKSNSTFGGFTSNTGFSTLPAPSISNVFNSSPSPPTTGVFASSPAPPATGVFASLPAPPVTSVFKSLQAPSTTGMFASLPAPPATSVFKSLPAPSATGVFAPLPAPSATGMFAPLPAPTATGMFAPLPTSSAPGVFAPLPVSPAAGVFAHQPASSATGGFAPLPAQPTTGGFVPIPAQPTTGGFAPIPAQPTTGGFAPLPAQPTTGGFAPLSAQPTTSVFAFGSSFNNKSNMFNNSQPSKNMFNNPQPNKNIFNMTVDQQVPTSKPKPFMFNMPAANPYAATQNAPQQTTSFNFGAHNATQGPFNFSPQQVPQVQQPTAQQPQPFNFSAVPANNNNAGGVLFNIGASAPAQQAPRRIRRAARRVHR